MMERLHQYVLLTRMHKPIGTYLLLWPTLWALWIAAGGLPDLHVLVVFVLGTFLMRSAGCVINDYADRAIDPHVERTKERPLATGSVSPREALLLFAALALIAFGLVLTLNELTIWLSLGGVFLAASYPFMKRLTHLPQIYLGLAFAWAVPMAFAAQTGEIPTIAWPLFLAPILWATSYDTMYAMVDREDDLKIGVKSTAVLLGRYDRLAIAILQLALLADLIIIGFMAELGLFYWLSLLVVAVLDIYHQILIKDRQKAPCFRAFLHNNWLGMAVFIGLLTHYLVQ